MHTHIHTHSHTHTHTLIHAQILAAAEEDEIEALGMAGRSQKVTFIKQSRKNMQAFVIIMCVRVEAFSHTQE